MTARMTVSPWSSTIRPTILVKMSRSVSSSMRQALAQDRVQEQVEASSGEGSKRGWSKPVWSNVTDCSNVTDWSYVVGTWVSESHSARMVGSRLMEQIENTKPEPCPASSSGLKAPRHVGRERSLGAGAAVEEPAGSRRSERFGPRCAQPASLRSSSEMTTGSVMSGVSLRGELTLAEIGQMAMGSEG